MTWTRTLGRSALAVMLIGAGASAALADQQKSNQGVGKGETSQQKSQQGLGVEGGGSSNVILGGPSRTLTAMSMPSKVTRDSR